MLPYVVDGDGSGPKLVFAHGLMGTGAMQRAQLDPLVDAGWTVVTFDQRGHGAAPPVTDPSRYDPVEMGADLWEVADAAGFGRCWIGGGSMGAATSWCAAKADAGRVEGLIQAIPALRDEPHPAVFMFDALADHLRNRGIDGLVEAIVRFIEMGGQSVDPSFVETLRCHDPVSLEVALRTVPRWVLSDVPAGLADVSFPVVVVGWDADPIHPLQTARDIAAAARVELIETEMLDPADEARFGRLLLEHLPAVLA